jgi:pimeloyl-ACP methyl ester carboxylesterase
MNRRAAARTPLAPSSSKSYLPVGSGSDKTGGLLVAEAKFVNIHGERIAVRDEGTGEALLLIHGMAGSSQTWRAILPQLAKKYRVIAPDLLGHGRSSKPRTDYSLGAFAVGLRDLLDELGVESATVVGQSLGGGVAMQFLYQHPAYCRRLVLISSGGLGPDVGLVLRLLAAPGAELIMPVIAPSPVLRAGNSVKSWLSSLGLRSPRGAEIWNAYSSFSDRQTRDAFLRTLRSVVDYRGQSVSALNRLNLRDGLPVLAIWGEQDTIIPVDHAYSALRSRPDCRLEVLPGVGHFAQVEAPTEVVELIDDFVSTTAAAQPSTARGGF